MQDRNCLISYSLEERKVIFPKTGAPYWRNRHATKINVELKYKKKETGD
jgi:hypothetical protein